MTSILKTLLLLSVISFLFFNSCTDTGTNSNRNSSSLEISGYVITSDTGKGIEAAKVTIHGRNIEVDSYTDKNGYFIFTEVPAGEYTVQLKLPKGFKEIDNGEKQIFAEESTQVDFLGEPIRQVSATVQEGKADTLSISSGASVFVEGSAANSGLEINIEEVDTEGSESGSGQYKPFRISMNTQGMNKNVNGRNQSSPSLVDGIFLRQKIEENSEWLNFGFKKEGEDLESFFGGNTVISEDSNTGKEIMELELELFETLGEGVNYVVNVFKTDTECKNEDNYRELNLVEDSNSDKKPVILIHGIQPRKKECGDFEDFDPESDSFEEFINEFLSDDLLSETFSLYTYKYMSIVRIMENSDYLWELIPEEVKREKPILIAHSMGGLVALGTISNEGMESFSGLITLGTPHNGSYLADINFDEDRFKEVRNELCRGENIAKLGCGTIYKRLKIFPNSPGLEDLKTESNPLIDELKPSNSEKAYIYTFYGSLESIDDIANRNSINPFKIGHITESVYNFSYRYMDEKLNKKNDGIVQVPSANPGWSENTIEMIGYDHEELRDGSNLNDLKPLFKKLKPILIELSGVLTAPEVITGSITQITPTSAISGGEITDTGGSDISKKGVCWNTSENPNLNDECTSDGTGSGSFESELSGLSANTTYFVRAYATNELGTGYGSERSFTTDAGSDDSNFIYASSAVTNYYGSDSPSNLYTVETTTNGSDTFIGRIKTSEGYEPVITDIAKSQENLWAVSWETLYKIDPDSALAHEVGDIGFNYINSLEVVEEGHLIAITIFGDIIGININEGRVGRISVLENDWEMSGDIAVDKNGLLYATVKRDDSDTNYLATLNLDSGEVSVLSPSDGIGFDNVYGLTIKDGNLYGLTTSISPQNGSLIEINKSTGIGKEIRKIEFQASGAAKEKD